MRPALCRDWICKGRCGRLQQPSELDWSATWQERNKWSNLIIKKSFDTNQLIMNISPRKRIKYKKLVGRQPMNGGALPWPRLDITVHRQMKRLPIIRLNGKQSLSSSLCVAVLRCCQSKEVANIIRFNADNRWSSLVVCYQCWQQLGFALSCWYEVSDE